MGEFVFDVFITAVVRVRAETEADARQALTSSALAAPSAADIGLANQASVIQGNSAVITDVDSRLMAPSSTRQTADVAAALGSFAPNCTALS